jgi:succinate dehydrogenase hydrophobic anchor subunit
MTETRATAQRDWLSQRFTTLLLYLLIALLVGTALVEGASPLRTWVWTALLTLLGLGCLVNAYRCRRTHCYFTGPWFLLMAAASGVHGFRIVSLGSHGWHWIEGLTLVGGLLLTWLPERLWGRYGAAKADHPT